jgi:succinoglycan biosynthesis protein ExoM
MLSRLLRSLEHLEIPSDAIEALLFIVIDNDAAGSAQDVVEGSVHRLPWEASYLIEPLRNIAVARNRGVEMALAWGADFVAFIDDDEEPSAHWLRELIEVQATHRADVVWGRVVPVFPPETPRWVVEGGFFDRGLYPSGKRMEVASTSNALVSCQLLRRLEGPFDAAFGRTGGSDSHLFQRAVYTGALIVWANDAVVLENVPRNRVTSGWVLRRALRVGIGTVRVERAVKSLWEWLPMRLAKASSRVVLGLAMLVFWVPFRGKTGLMMGLQNVMYGVGAYAGLLGVQYEAYREVDGE